MFTFACLPRSDEDVLFKNFNVLVPELESVAVVHEQVAVHSTLLNGPVKDVVIGGDNS